MLLIRLVLLAATLAAASFGWWHLATRPGPSGWDRSLGRAFGFLGYPILAAPLVTAQVTADETDEGALASI